MLCCAANTSCLACCAASPLIAARHTTMKQLQLLCPDVLRAVAGIAITYVLLDVLGVCCYNAVRPACCEGPDSLSCLPCMLSWPCCYACCPGTPAMHALLALLLCMLPWHSCYACCPGVLLSMLWGCVLSCKLGIPGDTCRTRWRRLRRLRC